MLSWNDRRVSQSLAIIDLLDRIEPKPRLVPVDDSERDRALEIALLVTADIHPLNNLRVLKYLTEVLGVSEEQKNNWYAHWIREGFGALEQLLPDRDGWCIGDGPTVADCCLVPQVANARRMGVDLSSFPRVLRVSSFCEEHSAFRRAVPSAQPDYVS